MEQRDLKTTIPRIVNPYVEETKSKTGRFMTLSLFVHAAMVATVSLMSFPPPELIKPEMIEIEMIGDGDALSMNEGVEVPGSAGMKDTSNGTEPDVPVAKVLPSEPAPAIEKAPPAPPQPAPLPIKSAAPATSAPKAPAPVHPVTPKPAPAPVAAAKPMVQETKAPDLETSETGEVPVSQLDDSEMQDEFERIDQTHQNSLAAAMKAQEEEATKEAAREAAAKQQALAEAKREEEAKALAAAEEARRRKEAEALATARAAEEAAKLREARAQERAQAEARARERAAAEAQAAREAKAAADARAAEEAEASRAAQAAAAAAAMADQASAGKAAAGEHGEGSGFGDGAPEGEGNSSSPEPTKQVAGIPGGVRTLGQLRQRPGNRLPQYEPRERLARQEGLVVFYAYVNKDGTLSRFKKSEGTGYENLDKKTLDALQRWKFYPGQEGWVEMPFQWSLKGEAQEGGGLLR